MMRMAAGDHTFSYNCFVVCDHIDAQSRRGATYTVHTHAVRRRKIFWKLRNAKFLCEQQQRANSGIKIKHFRTFWIIITWRPSLFSSSGFALEVNHISFNCDAQQSHTNGIRLLFILPLCALCAQFAKYFFFLRPSPSHPMRCIGQRTQFDEIFAKLEIELMDDRNEMKFDWFQVFIRHAPLMCFRGEEKPKREKKKKLSRRRLTDS